jgi:hypothetical protein
VELCVLKKISVKTDRISSKSIYQKNTKMLKPKPHSLALEVDRVLKLNLNNARFEVLVSFIDGYRDSQKISQELMQGDQQKVLDILKAIKPK